MTDTSISYGSKYARDLDVKEIAKLVRADIRAAIKAGELPQGFKASVTIDRYSMGQSLDVTVKAAPGVVVMNPTRLAHDLDNPHAYPGELKIHSDEGYALLARVEAIVEAYNFDGSDSMTDYFHVNFYSTTRFDHALESAERAAFKAAREAAATPAEKPRVHLTADCVEVARPALHLV